MPNETTKSTNLSDIIDAVAATNLGTTKVLIKEILTSAFAEINAKAQEGDVRIFNFGVFKLKQRSARTCRNPLNGAMVDVAASEKLTFKATKHKK